MRVRIRRVRRGWAVAAILAGRRMGGGGNPSRSASGCLAMWRRAVAMVPSGVVVVPALATAVVVAGAARVGGVAVAVVVAVAEVVAVVAVGEVGAGVAGARAVVGVQRRPEAGYRP